MRNYRAVVAAFVIFSLVLFSLGLFLIGDHHKAFSHHYDLYTFLQNVNGLASGSHVRVSGYEAGQIAEIGIPDQPNGRFRLKLHIDRKLENIIRADSVVTVETDGLVGDQFLLIHEGSNAGQKVEAGAVLPSREPIQISVLLGKVSTTIDQANATIGDLQRRLDGALDAVTTTVNETDKVVSSIRTGRGPVGALLYDEKMADNLRTTVANTQKATGNLDQVSVQAKQIVTDIQAKDFAGQVNTTLADIRHAAGQLDRTSSQLNISLTDALGPDASGQTASGNLRDTLSNIDVATGNLADDTEAIKHEFLFRGFFKKRGFYSLDDLTPDDYRRSRYFQSAGNGRLWLDASRSFELEAGDREVLSALGRNQIDAFIGAEAGKMANTAIVVEGYSDESSAGDQLVESKARSVIVRRYLEKRFNLSAKNIGLMPLQSEPPPTSGRKRWSGACLVVLTR